MPRLLPYVAMLLLAAVARAESWKVQYFYDRSKEELTLTDLSCPTAKRCIATGFISAEKGSPRPTAVVTSDGGNHWALVALKEEPLSLFLLDDSTGWIVGAKNLWKSIEGGRSWDKVTRLPPGMLRVYFLDDKHGWAVGAKKSVLETLDGGIEWRPVATASDVHSNPEYTVYNWIEFVAGKHGVITGFSRPPRRAENVPDWVDPEKAVTRKQWPTMSITLDTHDAGKTWTSSTASLFGQISRVRLSPAGVGLGLMSFTDNFDWPSEVFLIDWKNGKSSRVFRDRERRITDLAVISDKLAFLAGQDVRGKLHQNPIPGKLKMYKSEDLATWSEMEVDYRATASEAVLSAADANHVWVATDTGMILKLEP